MMKSLWSGVSGLRVHQTGMDVEGNNIANVNTYGFKYSRVNYNTSFSQTMAIATGPVGNLGGQNAMQVGLGVSANSTMRVHSQGSITGTGRNYDVAIEGAGYFLVSNDGGRNQYLTRDGSFNVDAAGNFVTTNGYVVQGWNMNPRTGEVDTSLPATNLQWDQDMTIPANPSSELWLNGTLNSGYQGLSANEVRSIYSLDSVHGFNAKTGVEANENNNATNQFYTTSDNALELTEKGVDMAGIFVNNGDNTYDSLNIREGQGFWVSFADATYSTGDTFGAAAAPVFDINNQQNQLGALYWGNIPGQPVTLDITINGVRIRNDQITSLDQAVQYINTFTSPTDTREGTGVRAVAKQDGSGIDFINTNNEGETDNMKNIRLTVNEANSAGERHRIEWDAVGQTFNVVNITNGNGAGGTTNSNWIAGNEGAAGTGLTRTVQVITAHKYTYSSSAPALTEMYNPDSGIAFAGTSGGVLGDGTQVLDDPAEEAYRQALQGGLLNNQARVFRTTEDLRELLQRDARYGVDYDGSGINGTQNGFSIADVNQSVTVTVDEKGSFVLSNPDSVSDIPAGVISNGAGAAPAVTDLPPISMSINISAFLDEANLISTNDALAGLFEGWSGSMTVGSNNKYSEEAKLANLGTNLTVIDSLGSSHQIHVEWTKISTTVDGGNEWQMVIRVEEPATINTTGVGPDNIIVGSIRFGSDGSLISYDPRTINFSANNGSAPNQQIRLNLGASGGYNGLVSNDQTSAVTGNYTDGYIAGTLLKGMDNTRIDQQGNIIASFSNGLSMVVGKIAMGTVVNDAGLEDIGGNMYKKTANSGEITVGISGTGGRGNMRSASVEMSNADLSLSLTNLIVIQRGYQANSKTISTSDQMLNTLLQLKQ